MSTELPPQVQNQIAQLQQLQQQAQALLGQKSQIEMMIRETESAVKELEASPEGAVIYKSVGEVLFKADRTKLIEEVPGDEGASSTSGSRPSDSNRRDPEALRLNLVIQRGRTPEL